MTDIVRRRVLWVVWAIVLVASLGAVVVLNRANAGSTAARSGEGHGLADAIARYGFRLDETARSVGVEFVHQGPTFDKQLDHIMPQVASMGASIAVADFNRDGWIDFYATNSAEGSQNHLYRNRGDGTFADVAASLGVADVNPSGTGVSMGSL
jgi:enediyne biosynthesis protein E4